MERPYFACRMQERITDAVVSRSNDPREAIAVERFDYIHSEEYTEWGVIVRVFIWTKMGALPREKREYFIQTALTNDGTRVRKLNKKNIDVLWPNAPKDWKDQNDNFS